MKVKDLLREIQNCQSAYGDEFLEWDVYTEQIRESKKDWKWLKDSEGWEYIECAGFWTKFPKEKAFTINVNY